MNENFSVTGDPQTVNLSMFLPYSAIAHGGIDERMNAWAIIRWNRNNEELSKSGLTPFIWKPGR